MSCQTLCAPDSERNGKQNIGSRQSSAAALNNTTSPSLVGQLELPTPRASRTVDSKDPDRDPAAGGRPPRQPVHRSVAGAAKPRGRRSVAGRLGSLSPIRRELFAVIAARRKKLTGPRDLGGVSGPREAGCTASPPARRRCLELVLGDNERLHLIRNL